MTPFSHFANNPAAVKRIRFVLGLYGITLFLCSVCLFIGHDKQDKAYHSELGHVKQELETLQKVFSQDPLASKTKIGDDAFRVIMGREPISGNDADKVLRTGITDDLVDHNFQLTAFFKSLIAERFPLIRFTSVLIAWGIFAVGYWLTIFYLYSRGMAPRVGEPVFNIIDVGFLGVLVKYTGGLEQSWFFVFYLFSFILVIYDLVTKKDRAPVATRGWGDKLTLITGPYFLALFLTTFWGTCERVLMGEQSIAEYLSAWLAIISVTVIVCSGIYLILANLTEDILARGNGNSMG